MRNRIPAVAVALLSVAGLAWAQDAGQQPKLPPGTTPPPSTANTTVRPTTTLVGCLYREDQVPGRKPNPAERAGILEDYILADASVSSAQAKPGSNAGATGTSGTSVITGNMYKVEGPSDERLKALVGKKVQVTGRIDPEGPRDVRQGGPRPDAGLGPDKISLPEVEASSIREVSGTCPSTPAPRN